MNGARWPDPVVAATMVRPRALWHTFAMTRLMTRVANPGVHLAGIQWRWVIPAGAGAAATAVAVWVALVSGYSALLAALTHGAPTWDRVGQFGAQGAWAVPMLTLALTALTAAWVARRCGDRAALHGALVGLVAAPASLLLWGSFHGAPGPWEWAAILLTAAAGWAGGLEARSAVAGREALYRASRAIASARSAQGIVDGVGAHLARSRADHAALWSIAERRADGASAEISLLATWPADASGPWSPGRRVREREWPILARLRRDAPTTIMVGALPPPERAAWERLGARAVVLLPLIAPGGAWVGLLTVIGPTARTLSGGAAEGYNAIGAQAALALENLRLVERGRQLGILEERQRLAREIHDAIKQQVFAAGMQLAAGRALLDRDPAGARERLAQADLLVRGAQDELAAVIEELRPAALEGRGLVATLRAYSATWSRQSGIPCAVAVRGERPLPLKVERALYRVAQGALANVARHSGATAVMVELDAMSDTAALLVSDNGRGFVPEVVRGRGYGLESMRERALALGGHLEVASTLGAGTRVTCHCPLAGPDEGRGEDGWASR